MHPSSFEYKNHIDEIYRHIIALCEFDRLPGSAEYDLSLDYIVAQLKTEKCRLNVFDFSGEDTYWNWTLPVGMSHWKDGREDTKIKFVTDRNLKLLEVFIPGEDQREIFLSHIYVILNLPQMTMHPVLRCLSSLSDIIRAISLPFPCGFFLP